jgi:ornithine--oxo-acid transaminase
VTAVSFSTEEQYRRGFGPFTPGFHTIPFGDAAALEHAINDNTCAFLVEPIQGEAGIIVPPEGYLRAAAEICRRNNVLLMTDEIQSGLGRTGKLFCYMYDDITPDVLIVGKALAGGCYPVSAVLAAREVMSVFQPGDHGSTFGGNPLACAVARAALRVIQEENLVDRSAQMGAHLHGLLADLRSPNIRAVRGKGLWVGVELTRPARPFCEALMHEGVLCKETHDRVLRIAPPLVITLDEVDWAFERIRKVLAKT